MVHAEMNFGQYESSTGPINVGNLQLVHEFELAEELVQKYFEKTDRQQFVQLAKFYTPDGFLVWNGSVVPQSKIQEFMNQLPTSNHSVMSWDVQQLLLDSGSFSIVVSGLVRFQNEGQKTFFQTLITSLSDDKYKVKMGNYRFID